MVEEETKQPESVESDGVLRLDDEEMRQMLSKRFPDGWVLYGESGGDVLTWGNSSTESLMRGAFRIQYIIMERLSEQEKKER